MTATARAPRRDALRNRALLLAAAQEAFAVDGLDASLEDVARRAGVGIGTLYRHFPTREALVEAIADEKIATWLAAIERAATRKDAWRGLRELLERTVELQLEHRALRAVLVESRRDDGRLAAARERMGTLLDELIARAQAQGSLRRDFTRADFAVLSWSLGPVIEATAESAPRAVRRHLHFVLDGLRPAAATRVAEPPLDGDELAASGRRLHELRLRRRQR